MVEGFPSELRQLFSNLIGNAIEASSKGGTIRVHMYNSCDWRHPQRRGLRVTIADNGVGIAAEHRGTLEKQPAHLVDLMATAVDLAGAKYPQRFHDNDILPMEGTSLRPALERTTLETKRMLRAATMITR